MFKAYRDQSAVEPVGPAGPVGAQGERDHLDRQVRREFKAILNHLGRSTVSSEE